MVDLIAEDIINRFNNYNDSNILRDEQQIDDFICREIESNLTNPEFSKYLSERYRATLAEIIRKFRNKLIQIPLPPVSATWAYEVFANDTGISLYYCHYSPYKERFCWDYRFLIYKEKSDLLTVSEFADLYGVKPNTVRVWIKRAKIRNIVYSSGVLKIPSLTDVPVYKSKKNYCAWYEFPEDFVPIDKYRYLQKYDRICFQMPKKRGEGREIQLSTTGYGKEYQFEYRTLTVKEAQELEAYCIEHPDIAYREALENVEINGAMYWYYDFIKELETK